VRVLAWFSCGAASAVAAKLARDKYGDQCRPVYCDTMASEHPDNLRFMQDVERWLGCHVTVIKSDRFASVDDVFMKTRYMSGIYGARCTVEMKKIPRIKFERPDDVHVFGLTADEGARITRFVCDHPDMKLEWVLQEAGLTKADCLKMVQGAGIVLPTMYALGYRNNNCIGCVKATSARYWNMTRRDFPEVFEKRAMQSRELGVRLTRLKGERIFLDELPPDYLAGDLEDVSCGPDCSALSFFDLPGFSS
jgi:hypothetical protein